MSKRIDSRPVNVEVSQADPAAVDAGLLVVGLFEDGELPEALAAARGAAEARGGYKKLAALHPERPGRALVVGLGKREDFDAERARVAAALAAKEAARLEASSVAWILPEADGPAEAIAEGIVTGTILGSYRFDRFLAKDPDDPPPPALESLLLLAPAALAEAAEAARVCAEAQNRARDLQSLPSNVATPSFLARRAREIASSHERVKTDVLGREEIAAKEMGGLAAVSQGSVEEPQLIVLRYSGGGEGPTLGLVGKGVTFDTGGISIKPSAGMQEMKMDMSGAAAVIEAVAAIAELELPIDLVAVVPSTENMPSGTAVKPGDVITQYNGKTVEVNNTDAEGRLILADALAYAIELGAERVVDLATLTGAVLIALGSTYAAVISNDDDLAGEVERAGEATGELVWRLPLHAEFKALMKGTVADLSNLASKRKAGTITAAAFLEEFVGETPWAHSTSPAPPGTSAASTPATTPAATACGCWSSWPATPRRRTSNVGIHFLRKPGTPTWPRRPSSACRSSGAEDHAGGGAVGEQLAAVGGGQRRLRGRLFAPPVEDVRLAEDPAGVAGDRAHVLRLEAERRVADPGRERGVDGAAESRVEQGRRVAAVDDADRVVVLLAGLALEDGSALGDLDRAHPHHDRDRRRRDPGLDHRGHVLDAGHRRPGGGGRHRVLPDQRAAAAGLRAVLSEQRRRLGGVGRAPLRSPALAAGGHRAVDRARGPARRIEQVGGDLGLADRDPRGLRLVLSVPGPQPHGLPPIA